MKALLLYPEFSPLGFWNYKAVCQLVGAKYPASPLGMITVGALLPWEWELRLIDLNTAPLDDADIDWADLVFIGGMLPQQSRFLQLIDRVHDRGKRVVAGGPDVTSQPEVYASADYLVLGEAECSMPDFLADLERGATSGRYVPDRRPEMTESPVPRFDLLNLNSYLMIGVQFSRGCPFNCEFCDIIELYGRKPRTKPPAQVMRELDALYALGYRGHVDFVDDNFIGHKAKAKDILRAVKKWSAEHGHPFFFSTEASINVADDDELLGLMRDLDFRYLFIGIESPEDAILSATQKSQNLRRDLVADLHKIYDHGIVVNGGFILGFDDETSTCAGSMIDVIERGNIVMSMIGLLYALPNTQLTRRLQTENRLLKGFGRLSAENEATEVDQATSGLNFITKRPRAEVLDDFLHVLEQTYSTKKYFDRCLRLAKVIRVEPRFKPNWKRKLRYASAFLKCVVGLGVRPATAYLFWRNIGILLFTRISAVETAVNVMAMYLHFGPQTEFISGLTSDGVRKLGAEARGPERCQPPAQEAEMCAGLGQESSV
jgi:radical SAM superfamily enzyme YgiQ (UPF0313 family)